VQEKDAMAVRVLIKRTVPEEKLKEVIGLFRELRNLATSQPGYISGETLRRLGNRNEFLVISTWESSDDWNKWLATRERNEVQGKIDALLSEVTEYEIFYHGFWE
jgi:heme-degrading monooxygenase HmoA